MGHWFLHQPHTARRGGEVFARGERGGCGSQYSDGSLIWVAWPAASAWTSRWTGEDARHSRSQLSLARLSLANYPWVRSRTSACHAIWIASSLASFDFAGSSLKPGSSITYLCRSVKRTVSGSSLGWVSESRIPMSSESLQVSSFGMNQCSCLWSRLTDPDRGLAKAKS